MASVSSANPDVRKKLVELQQELARRENVVMDGRDIGTCVLPDANVKVYLTASTACRAKRRYDELTAKRDHQDMTREHSPLRQAEDAVLLDSSDLTIEEVVERILGLVKDR